MYESKYVWESECVRKSCEKGEREESLSGTLGKFSCDFDIFEWVAAENEVFLQKFVQHKSWIIVAQLTSVTMKMKKVPFY